MATFVATQATVPASATSATATLPTGWAAGDLVLIAVLGKYRGADASVPTGWTDVTGRLQHSLTTTGADVGNVFAKVYARVMQAGDTAPTFTATATINSWVLIAEAWRPASGKTWTDAANLASVPWVSFDDTATGNTLTGSATFATQPDAAAGPQISLFGVTPQDVSTGQGAVTATNSGLSGGTVTARQYAENALGGDCSGASWTWTGFTGTATGATSWSSVFTSATNAVGLGVALWLRESSSGTTYSADASQTITATQAATADVGPPPVTIDAAQTVTATQAAGGATTKPVGATQTVTATQTGQAQVTDLAQAAQSVTAAQSAAASATRTAGAVQAMAVTQTADATVAVPSVVTIAASQTIPVVQSAGGTAVRTAQASQTVVAVQSAEAASPTYWFAPPTVPESHVIDATAGLVIQGTRAVSVLKEDGAYRQVDYGLSQVEMAAADVVYLGGHLHPIDAAEKAALEAAGYGAYIRTV